ncbi:hypothetical protein [Kitasatospora cineracea]|uniref:hypothetical protein n=1 Tax=Kitasatospora cineracea TaxID=88074 RepID=UPI00368E21FB
MTSSAHTRHGHHDTRNRTGRRRTAAHTATPIRPPPPRSRPYNRWQGKGFIPCGAAAIGSRTTWRSDAGGGWRTRRTVGTDPVRSYFDVVLEILAERGVTVVLD